LGPTFFSFGV
jgi:hypothetical protein